MAFFSNAKRKIGSMLPRTVKFNIKKMLRLYSDMRVLYEIYRTQSEKRYILILTPDHANIGDHAITISEKKFMDMYFKDDKLIEVPIQTWMLYKREICKLIYEEDKILINGGGFLGTLWLESEEEFRDILMLLPKNRIIVFPQTIFFDETVKGKEQLILSKEVYSSHKQLCLCVRDKASYDFVIEKKMLSDLKKCYLIPDMVTFCENYKSAMVRKNIVLLCMRNDHEREAVRECEQGILEILHREGFSVQYTNTVISHYIRPEKRNEEVEKKMCEFSSAKLVITDRLHGMLLSAVTGTPCLFMDNKSMKVSGAYSWICNLEYIKPLENVKQLEEFIVNVVNIGNFQYEGRHLKEYFDNLATIIKEQE